MLGQLIGSGKTADVYVEEEGTVLKLFRPDVPDFLIDQELHAHECAQAAQLPIPRVYGKKEAEGRTGIVYERVQGVSLLELLFQNPGDVKQKAVAFAALHRHIHAATSENLPSLKAIIMRNLQGTDALTADEKAAVAAYLDTLPDGKQLCHMDFHPDNILYTENGPVMLDWMTAVAGDALADVARTVVILTYAALPEGLPEPVKAGITAIREALVAAYRTAYFAGEEEREKEMEAWFLPIMAARLCENVPADELERLVGEIRNRLAAI